MQQPSELPALRERSRGAGHREGRTEMELNSQTLPQVPGRTAVAAVLGRGAELGVLGHWTGCRLVSLRPGATGHGL